MDNKLVLAQDKLNPKPEYDPHILYNAINLTAELQYKVPMQRIYDILVIVEKKNKGKKDKAEMITPEDIMKLLNILGDLLIKDASDSPCDTSSLQAKIKELLRILGCTLSDQDLNKILKGQISITDVLSKDAQLVWQLLFDVDAQGKMRPDHEMADHLLISMQNIAIENIERQMESQLIENRNRKMSAHQRAQNILLRDENLKTLFRTDEEKKRSRGEDIDYVELDRKRAKLRLYIAHMQGYDRDRDHDGSRAVDPTTGYIIDYEDAYITDKIYSGAILEDRNTDDLEVHEIV